MRSFLIGSIVTITIIILFLSYRQNIFETSPLPYDDEQTGLDDQIIIHFSHVVAENTPKGASANKFANLVYEKTNGQVIVQVYPNGILYNDHNELEALQKGDVQMIAPTFSKLTTYIPSWQVLDLPFIFKNDAQVQKALTGPTSKELLRELDPLQVKGLTFWTNGFKQIATSAQPILQTNHFKNVKIRVMSSSLGEQYTFLDAKPFLSTFGDAFSNLENKLYDAQENTLSNIYSKGFYTIENNITLTNHGLLGYVVLMNQDFWNNLDESTQEDILEAMEETTEWQFGNAVKMNQEDLMKLEDEQNVFIHKMDEVEKNEWKRKLTPIYEMYEKDINDEYLQKLLNEISK